MLPESPKPREDTPDLAKQMYDQVLDGVREVSDKAIDRLRQLKDQIPAGLVEQIERLHEDPLHERRKTVRVSDERLPVAVQLADLSEAPGEPVLKDHGPVGLAVLLPCPAGVGTILRVQLPPEVGRVGWVTVEVKYCRKEESGWVAGCELLAEQPPG